MCEAPHRLQLKLYLSLFSSNDPAIFLFERQQNVECFFVRYAMVAMRETLFLREDLLRYNHSGYLKLLLKFHQFIRQENRTSRQWQIAAISIYDYLAQISVFPF